MTKTTDKQGALSTNNDSALHITNPLSSRALFWRSRYMVESDFLNHLPFAFWLADVLRPTTIVEIGVDDGQSYFALCQAVDRLNLPARCHGILFNHPSEDAKDEDKARLERLRQIQQYNAENYVEFSKLSSRPQTEALNRFADQSIDLLVLGANQSAEALERTLELCGQKLSDRAVVLLRGFPDAFEDGQHDMLARSFMDRHSTLLFEDDTGLAAVLVGTQPEERLAQLASLKSGSADYNSIHLVFSRLGQAHHNEWTSRTNRERSEKAHNSLEVSQRKHSKLTTEFDQLTKAYNTRSEVIATTQAENFDLNQQLTKMRAEEKDAAAIAKDRIAWKAKYRALEATATQDAANLETLEAEITKMRAERDQQKTALETQLAEITDLTQKLNALTEKADAAQTRVYEADAEISQQRETHLTEVTALTKKLEAQTAEIQAAQTRADEADAANSQQRKTHLAEVTALTRELEAQTAEIQAAQTRADEADAANSQQRKTHLAEVTALTRELERYSLVIKGHRMHVQQLEEALSQTLSTSEKQKAVIHEKTTKSAYDDQYRQVQIRLRQIQTQRLSKSKGRLAALIGRSEEQDLKRQAEVVRRHSLFDAEWYLANYTDVRSAGVDPALHFVTTGVYEGRNPGPEFNTVDYYVRHPDKLEGDINPLLDDVNKGPEAQK